MQQRQRLRDVKIKRHRQQQICGTLPPSWALLLRFLHELLPQSLWPWPKATEMLLRHLQMIIRLLVLIAQTDVELCERLRHKQTMLLEIGSLLTLVRHCAFYVLVMRPLYAERYDVYMYGFGMRQPNG